MGIYKSSISCALLGIMGIQYVFPTHKLSDRPNIVFIMADDLGWSDLGCMGSDYYETPNIDRLATEGLVFDNAYAAAANSAPSRACFMTGMYTPRHGVYTVSPSERGARSKRKLIPIANTDEVHTNFVTLAEALSAEGYQCAHIGKWHLGGKENQSDPLSQGFVYNVGGDKAGSPYSYFFPYCLTKRNQCHYGLTDGLTGEYLTDRLTNEAISFMKSHKDRPFFLHLAHYAVHTPLQAPDSLVRKYKDKSSGRYHNNSIYAAMIEKLDDSVGRICQTIKDLGLDEHTLIVFYSDNGGSEPITDNYPLRGGKGMPYEGGIREPLIMKWPVKIKAGTRTSIPVIGIDFYPTFVKLARGTISPELDGEDIFSLIKENVDSRDLFWHFPAYLESYDANTGDFRATPYSIIRSGQWKLIYYYENKSMELFDLKNDPYESKDLSKSEITKCKVLRDKLFTWLATTHAPIPREENPYYKP